MPEGVQNSNSPSNRWTVMFYFASDDVELYDVENLTKLKKAGSTNEVQLLAQVDPTGNKQSTRYWLNRHTKLDEDVVRRSSNIDAGTPKALIDFVEWGVKSAPAEHYMVVIWGHGDGWQNEDNAGRAAGRIINVPVDKGQIREALGLSDETDPLKEKLLDRLAFLPNRDAAGMRGQDVLDGPALKEVFVQLHDRLGRKIDLLGMDSCLMAMVEVAYQVRDGVDYMVACEDVSPVGSWPYDSIFLELIKHPQMSPAQLGQIVVRHYLIEYLDQTRFVTQSVCRPGRSGDLANSISSLGVELLRGLQSERTRTAILTARAIVQSYYIKDYVDLYNYCDILAGLVGNHDEGLSDACQTIKAIIGDAVPLSSTRGKMNGNVEGVSSSQDAFIASHGYYGYPLSESHGASIYFPCLKFSKQYGHLDIAKATDWAHFLRKYVNLVTPGTTIDEEPEEGGTASGGHLGGMAGDGQLGPGDPILIPPDPFGHH